VPNKTEAAYMSHLEGMKKRGEITAWWFEEVTLVLSRSRPNVKVQQYTPDFMVMLTDGLIEFHEVKGFAYQTGMNKLKVAGDKFPFTFRLAKKNKKAQGGGWDIIEY
jgi:hypothetical protein